jgi:hypothetical protein
MLPLSTVGVQNIGDTNKMFPDPNKTEANNPQETQSLKVAVPNTPVPSTQKDWQTRPNMGLRVNSWVSLHRERGHLEKRRPTHYCLESSSFSSWISGRQVTVFTDHRWSLESWYKEDLCTMVGLLGQRSQWHEILSQCNVVVAYHPPKDKDVANKMPRWAHPAGLADVGKVPVLRLLDALVPYMGSMLTDMFQPAGPPAIPLVLH